VCVCTITDFSGEDRASGVKFCTVVHRRPGQGISHFGELCSPRSSHRSPKSDETANSVFISDNTNGTPKEVGPQASAQASARGLCAGRFVQRRIGMCGYTAVPKDGRTCLDCVFCVVLCWFLFRWLISVFQRHSFTVYVTMCRVKRSTSFTLVIAFSYNIRPWTTLHHIIRSQHKPASSSSSRPVCVCV